MKNIYKCFGLLFIFSGLVACEIDEIEPNLPPEAAALPALQAGSLDFSKYVAVGASFTAGFTDGALFLAGQQYSFPNILSQQFAKAGGGSFTQPLTNDNIGGLLFGGNVIQGTRLFFNGAGPASLPGTPTNEITAGTPGPYSNMGVPGAKSFHLLFDGYGNPGNLLTDPATANPFFVRMASGPTATMLGDAMDQNPTFFTLSEIGGNDVLGYATSGGDGSNPITPSAGPAGVGFDATFATLVGALTSGGAKGAVTNVPFITDLPHFTTVPHNPVPLDAATAGAVNQAYAAYNAGLQAVLDGINAGLIPQAAAPNFDQAEVDRRQISFTAGEGNAVVIADETLSNLTGINPALVSMRQATAEDLLVLPSSSFIGSLDDPNNPLSVNGVAIPLADKWVLLPSEQEAIRDATLAYNATIEAVTTANPNVVLVDLNSVLTEASMSGVKFDNYNMTTDLVFGGLVSLDGIHLTSRGYGLMANKFLEALDAGFGSNFAASGSMAKADDLPIIYPPSLQ